MTSPSAPPKPKSLMERIKELEERGWGYEDIAVELEIPKAHIRPYIIRGGKR
jgi:orotate phosphoribosyltransferase-like protein